MKTLIGAIRSVFTNEVEIRVSRDLVTVTWDGQSRSVRAVVHLATGAGRIRVIGVGDDFGSVEASVPVPIFGPLPPSVSLATWAEVMTTFMGYVIKQARAGIVAVRPTVHLRGVRTLGPLPGGNAEPVLTDAVLRARAFRCKVED